MLYEVITLATLYMEMQQYDKVEEPLTQAQSIYKQKFGEQNPQYAKATFQLGAYYQAVGNYDKAEELLKTALDVQILTLDEHHPDIANTYEFLAVNYWHKEMSKDALVNYQKALDGYIFQFRQYEFVFYHVFPKPHLGFR